MENKLGQRVTQYRELGIDNQIDYDKFYLYSLITTYGLAYNEYSGAFQRVITLEELFF